MCVSKARGWPRAGVGKCPAPGQRKICKCPTPGTNMAGKFPAVARGGGGAGDSLIFCGTQFSGDGVLRISSYGDVRMRTKINLPPRKKIHRVSYKTHKIPAQKLPLPPPAKKKKHGKRDLVPGHRHRTRILAWVWLKKECVHISAQRVPYIGTKCERCITLPRATKETGPVCRHAGHLFH